MDIIASNLGKMVSEISDMFVIGIVSNTESSEPNQGRDGNGMLNEVCVYPDDVENCVDDLEIQLIDEFTDGCPVN